MGRQLADDPRWTFGVPPQGNVNFAWVQHFVYPLSPRGTAGFVLVNGSLSSKTSGEGGIRRKLVEADLVDSIVAMPDRLFLNTGISVALWFLSKDRHGNGHRGRVGEVLFIDARRLGRMESRRLRVLDDADICLWVPKPCASRLGMARPRAGPVGCQTPCGTASA